MRTIFRLQYYVSWQTRRSGFVRAAVRAWPIYVSSSEIIVAPRIGTIRPTLVMFSMATVANKFRVDSYFAYSSDVFFIIIVHYLRIAFPINILLYYIVSKTNKLYFWNVYKTSIY